MGSVLAKHQNPEYLLTEGAIRLEQDPHSEEKLNECLGELIEASELFAKDGYYKRSEKCDVQARLLSLQLALLPTSTNVLTLNQTDLNDLIVNSKSFYQAYILAEAYNCHWAWRQALFKNVLLEGCETYLDAFCTKCELSSSMIRDLVRLYKKHITTHQISPEESTRLARALKLLLKKVPDPELRCKFYNQFNFDDAKEELLEDPAVKAYLMDLKLA